jgi:hypothetical protein
MDVLPTRTAQTVEQMLPVAMKFFAEVLVCGLGLMNRHYVIILRMLLLGFRSLRELHK